MRPTTPDPDKSVLRLLQEQLVEALAGGGLALQLAELALGLPVAGPCPQHTVKLLLECGDPRLRGRRLALEASHDAVRLLPNLGREILPLRVHQLQPRVLLAVGETELGLGAQQLPFLA